MCKEVIDYRSFDRDIWESELEEFVPRKIHDMHTHLWTDKHAGTHPDPHSPPRKQIDFQKLRACSELVFPAREVHFLALGTPIKGMDVAAHNAWLAAQVAQDSDSGASMIITPDMKPDVVNEQARTHDFLGFKPYRSFAPDKTNARIRDYMPEPLIEAADDLGCVITLHLSMKTGIADARNLEDLKSYTSRYPHVQWILAHCARAFNSFMLEEPVHILRDLPNIWYDTSAVNDLYSHLLLLKNESRRRIMFGSDNVPAGCMRGKYITYGRAWEKFKGFDSLEHCDPTPTLVVYEQLRQQRQAADILGLTRSEIDDLFLLNAQRLIRKIRTERA